MSITSRKSSRRKRSRDGAAATFHRRLEHLRKERALTQAELARRLGVQRTIVASYEHGQSLPPLPMLEKLSKALEVSLDHLVFSDLEPSRAIKDRDLLQLFVQAEELDFAEKAVLKQVLEGLLARRHMKKAV
jgi:transcriptional regulator with XRE-family HTH domain